VYDRLEPGETLTSLAAEFQISKGTGPKWLHDRTERGQIAYRSKRRQSKKLGRKYTVPWEDLHDLTVPSKNPVRNRSLGAQIDYFGIPISERTLQENLRTRLRKARLYKAAWTKPIHAANRAARIAYAKERQGLSINDYWHRVVFTDEAHIDPDTCMTPYILREEGTRYDPENVIERPQKQGVKIHIAGWCNWHEKAPELVFYNDEMDNMPKPKRPPKPRRSKYETEEAYNQRVFQWELTLPHDVEVKPKGNSMTMKYYSEKILPICIQAVQDFEKKSTILSTFFNKITIHRMERVERRNRLLQSSCERPRLRLFYTLQTAQI